jgi:DNA polymerase-3 subunit gamma/tau
VSIDPQRLSDPEVVFESDRQRLQGLVTRFSREDLLRSFDLVARAEADVRLASQPRYTLEMALLKWIHLRKLLPLADLIGQLEKGAVAPKPAQSLGSRPSFPPRPPAPPPRASAPVLPATTLAAASRPVVPVASTPASAADGPLPADFKDRFLAELQQRNRTFFNLHVATAQKIELEGGRLVFTFGPVHETMRQQVDARRQWLESLAESVAGRKVGVATARSAATDAPGPRPTAGIEPPAPAASLPDADLKARALADGGVQAMLDVFPAEIREVEEIK